MNTNTFLQQRLGASKEEIPRLTDMAITALREDADLSPDQIGVGGERLWTFLGYPYYLGIFARRVLAADGISTAVKVRLCHTVLRLNVYLDAENEPGPGLFQLTAWLYENDILDYDDYVGLRRGLIYLPQLTGDYVESTDFIFPACTGIFTDVELSRQETIELILMILTAKEAIHDTGRATFDHIVTLLSKNKSLTREVCQLLVDKDIPFARGEFDHPFEVKEEEEDRLLTRFLPGIVRRRAVVWLSRLGRNTIDLLDKLLQPTTVRPSGGNHVACGALDLLNEEWENLSPEDRERFLEQAASLPNTGVRKRAYILGEKYVGQEFLQQSLDDKAKSLREWARDRIEDREKNPAPPVEVLDAELDAELDE